MDHFISPEDERQRLKTKQKKNISEMEKIKSKLNEKKRAITALNKQIQDLKLEVGEYIATNAKIRNRLQELKDK